MVDNFASLRREMDMARNDLMNHAKTLSEFTERFAEIAAWQASKDIKDARQEEREKTIVKRLDGITAIGKAILTVLLSGFGLAFIAFIVSGGISVK